ncbi:peptide ABC transporter substrate-binding protein [Enemella dayhoffiae]|uniref:Peptide ABC transporter substrate-binding protein n=1 Tax=Enemella dayhoffiae TaxID=2016507 RepID=A0A255H511_9ACTN|nr:ABC transporter substrate-binding protein [Enemella dayhoffiae]OYO22426.1 peptide ABC transporter substrate-binding protein [Enemella dayhoffiae]
MRGRSRLMVAAASASIVALAFSACGGGGNTGGNTGGGKSGGEISMRGCTPQNPLIPANTNEVCGGNVLDAVTAKLVRYNPDTAKPENDLAESIKTDDNQNFTVKLKSGAKFSDGTPVKAENFVKAWNFSAQKKQGYLSGYFMEPIEGYLDVHPDEGDAKSEQMSGLKVVDETTFTIKTTSPVSNLPLRLGYTAFAALPDSFFKDPEAYGKMPVGAGPFKVTQNNEQAIILEKDAGYTGPKAGKVDKVTYKIYNDANAAYNDVVANNLDFTDIIPADQLVGDAWKATLQGRSGQKESGVIQSLAFSPKDEQLKDVRKRQALSMSLNRDLVTKTIFNGSRVPATGWVSPVVDGAKAGQCGDVCKYDEAKAKQLWQEAGGYNGPLTLGVNGDGGHKQWADAACNNWRTVLGIDCRVVITPNFKTLRNQIKNGELKGLFRSGWQMDYPSIENFLTPIYKTGASSNDFDYSNPAFDKKLVEADAAKDPDQANKLYQEAEAMLAKDLPTVPKWYSSVPYGHSNKVTNVKVTPFGTLDLSSITLK